jgi:hypothetical protein
VWLNEEKSIIALKRYERELHGGSIAYNLWIFALFFTYMYLFRLPSMDNANRHGSTLWIGVCTKTQYEDLPT